MIKLGIWILKPLLPIFLFSVKYADTLRQVGGVLSVLAAVLLVISMELPNCKKKGERK